MKITLSNMVVMTKRKMGDHNEVNNKIIFNNELKLTKIVSDMH